MKKVVACVLVLCTALVLYGCKDKERFTEIDATTSNYENYDGAMMRLCINSNLPQKFENGENAYIQVSPDGFSGTMEILANTLSHGTRYLLVPYSDSMIWYSEQPDTEEMQLSVSYVDSQNKNADVSGFQCRITSSGIDKILTKSDGYLEIEGKPDATIYVGGFLPCEEKKTERWNGGLYLDFSNCDRLVLQYTGNGVIVSDYDGVCNITYQDGLHKKYTYTFTGTATELVASDSGLLFLPPAE
jgi:hypothetical protein